MYKHHTSIQHHIRLDVTGCQRGQELCEQASEGIIVPSMLLVQAMVKVQAEIQTAAIDDQATVPEPDVLQEASVPLHIGGQTLDTHETSGPGDTRRNTGVAAQTVSWS